MAAALTLAVLLTVFIIFVRIASVTMRLTGLPDHVARFQSISALTGAGFTTTESEMIVNYPIRRRVIVALMILGNLGLVSVATTFLVAFTQSDGTMETILRQALSLLLVVLVMMLLMTNKLLDRALCGLIGRVISKTTQIHRSYHRLLTLAGGHNIGEHTYRGKQDRLIREIVLAGNGLTLLAVQGEEVCHLEEFNPEFRIAPNETLICIGSDTDHRLFADYLVDRFATD